MADIELSRIPIAKKRFPLIIRKRPNHLNCRRFPSSFPCARTQAVISNSCPFLFPLRTFRDCPWPENVECWENRSCPDVHVLSGCCMCCNIGMYLTGTVLYCTIIKSFCLIGSCFSSQGSPGSKPLNHLVFSTNRNFHRCVPHLARFEQLMSLPAASAPTSRSRGLPGRRHTDQVHASSLANSVWRPGLEPAQSQGSGSFLPVSPPLVMK
jgi:hypothetical protein